MFILTQLKDLFFLFESAPSTKDISCVKGSCQFSEISMLNAESKWVLYRNLIISSKGSNDLLFSRRSQ